MRLIAPEVKKWKSPAALAAGSSLFPISSSWFGEILGQVFGSGAVEFSQASSSVGPSIDFEHGKTRILDRLDG